MRRSSSAVHLRVHVDVSPAYELLLSMSVVAAGHPTRLVARMCEAAPGTASEIAAFSPSDWMWTHLITLAAEAPPPRDGPALLAYLARTPSREIQRRLLGYYVRWFRRMTPAEIIDRAIAGDAGSMRELLRTSQPEDPTWQQALRQRLEAGAARTKAELVALAEAWYERTGHVLRASRRRLAAATSARRRALRGSSVEDVVGAFTGWTYVPEPGITRIVIVPSLVLEGALHEFEHEQTKFVCVPVAGPEPPVPPSLVITRLRALADESRMRLVLTLAEGEANAQELADRSGLGLTTALHHLGTLRDAGLVSGGGRRLPYRLRRPVVRRLADSVRALTTP